MSGCILPLCEVVRSQLRSGITITSVAQCVEELVLNSLDAGATCIAVRINFSLFKIQVVDNGHGIKEEDLNYLGMRHATSKCHSLEDLSTNLSHYGFRGEALATTVDISAIVDISTKPQDSTRTLTKLFTYGKMKMIGPAKNSRPSMGTTVTIQDFMYNMPVRRKIIKEAIDIENVRKRLESFALMHPKVTFSLRNDGTNAVILQTKKTSSPVSTFIHLFGAERAQGLAEVEHSIDQFTIKGYISTQPHINKTMQFVYVNKRVILKTKIHKMLNFLLSRCSVISSRMHPGSVSSGKATSPVKGMRLYGIFFLNIECPHSEYDICLDPTKTLVEFREWDKLLICIEEMFLKFIQEEDLVISLSERYRKSGKWPEEEEEEIVGSSSMSQLEIFSLKRPGEKGEKSEAPAFCLKRPGEKGETSKGHGPKYGRTICTQDNLLAVHSLSVKRAKKLNNLEAEDKNDDSKDQPSRGELRRANKTDNSPDKKRTAGNGRKTDDEEEDSDFVSSPVKKKKSNKKVYKNSWVVDKKVKRDHIPPPCQAPQSNTPTVSAKVDEDEERDKEAVFSGYQSSTECNLEEPTQNNINDDCECDITSSVERTALDTQSRQVVSTLEQFKRVIDKSLCKGDQKEGEEGRGVRERGRERREGGREVEEEGREMRGERDTREERREKMSEGNSGSTSPRTDKASADFPRLEGAAGASKLQTRANLSTLEEFVSFCEADRRKAELEKYKTPADAVTHTPSTPPPLRASRRALDTPPKLDRDMDRTTDSAASDGTEGEMACDEERGRKQIMCPNVVYDEEKTWKEAMACSEAVDNGKSSKCCDIYSDVLNGKSSKCDILTLDGLRDNIASLSASKEIRKTPAKSTKGSSLSKSLSEKFKKHQSHVNTRSILQRFEYKVKTANHEQTTSQGPVGSNDETAVRSQNEAVDPCESSENMDRKEINPSMPEIKSQKEDCDASDILDSSFKFQPVLTSKIGDATFDEEDGQEDGGSFHPVLGRKTDVSVHEEVCGNFQPVIRRAGDRPINFDGAGSTGGSCSCMNAANCEATFKMQDHPDHCPHTWNPQHNSISQRNSTSTVIVPCGGGLDSVEVTRSYISQTGMHSSTLPRAENCSFGVTEEGRGDVSVVGLHGGTFSRPENQEHHQNSSVRSSLDSESFGVPSALHTHTLPRPQNRENHQNLSVGPSLKAGNFGEPPAMHANTTRPQNQENHQNICTMRPQNQENCQNIYTTRLQNQENQQNLCTRTGLNLGSSGVNSAPQDTLIHTGYNSGHLGRNREQCVVENRVQNNESEPFALHQPVQRRVVNNDEHFGLGVTHPQHLSVDLQMSVGPQEQEQHQQQLLLQQQQKQQLQQQQHQPQQLHHHHHHLGLIRESMTTPTALKETVSGGKYVSFSPSVLTLTQPFEITDIQDRVHDSDLGIDIQVSQGFTPQTIDETTSSIFKTQGFSTDTLDESGTSISKTQGCINETLDEAGTSLLRSQGFTAETPGETANPVLKIPQTLDGNMCMEMHLLPNRNDTETSLTPDETGNPVLKLLHPQDGSISKDASLLPNIPNTDMSKYTSSVTQSSDFIRGLNTKDPGDITEILSQIENTCMLKTVGQVQGSEPECEKVLNSQSLLHCQKTFAHSTPIFNGILKVHPRCTESHENSVRCDKALLSNVHHQNHIHSTPTCSDISESTEAHPQCTQSHTADPSVSQAKNTEIGSTGSSSSVNPFSETLHFSQLTLSGLEGPSPATSSITPTITLRGKTDSTDTCNVSSPTTLSSEKGKKSDSVDACNASPPTTSSPEKMKRKLQSCEITFHGKMIHIGKNSAGEVKGCDCMVNAVPSSSDQSTVSLRDPCVLEHTGNSLDLCVLGTSSGSVDQKQEKMEGQANVQTPFSDPDESPTLRSFAHQERMEGMKREIYTQSQSTDQSQENKRAGNRALESESAESHQQEGVNVGNTTSEGESSKSQPLEGQIGDICIQAQNRSHPAQRWKEVIDGEGRRVYVDLQTGNTSYDPPQVKDIPEWTSSQSLGAPLLKVPLTHEPWFVPRNNGMKKREDFTLTHGFTDLMSWRKTREASKDHDPGLGVKNGCSESVANDVDTDYSDSKGEIQEPSSKEVRETIDSFLKGVEAEKRAECEGNVQQFSDVAQICQNWEAPDFAMDAEVLNTGAEQITRTGKRDAAVKVYNAVYEYRFTKDMLQTCKVLGQVDDKYIACSLTYPWTASDSSTPRPTQLLVLFDQHAVHERIRLEEITRENYEEPDEDSDKKPSRKDRQNQAEEDEKRLPTLRSATMTPPMQLSLPRHEVRLMMAFPRVFTRRGLHFSQIDSETVSFHAIPSCLVAREANEARHRRCQLAASIVESTVRDMCHTLQCTGGIVPPIPTPIANVLNSQACRGAVKFGDHLSLEQCRELISSLASCQLPFQCAHGRPSIMPLINLAHLPRPPTSDQKSKPSLWKLRECQEHQ